MRVTHPWDEILHKVTGMPDVRYRVTHHRLSDDQGELLARGGKTVVQLGFLAEGEERKFVERARGVARCNPLDTYDRKVGRDMALRDALRQWKELYASDGVASQHHD